MENSSNRCPVCGGPVEGRPGKRFCSVKCKNAYHNERNLSRVRDRRLVVSILEDNYAILNRMLCYGVNSIGMQKAVELGFNPNYSTGSRRGISGHIEHRCFDIVYYTSVSRIYGMRRDVI